MDRNAFGRLPVKVGASTNKNDNIKVLKNVTKIDCEYHYSAALLDDGRLVLWGRNSHGQLGVGDTVDRALPQQASGLSQITFFSLGSRYAAAVTKHGALFCWGEGIHGNLGLGDRKGRLVPTRVNGNDLDLHVVVHVACSRGQGWHRSRGDSLSTTESVSNKLAKQKMRKKKCKAMPTMQAHAKPKPKPKPKTKKRVRRKQRNVMDTFAVRRQLASSTARNMNSLDSSVMRDITSGDEGAHTIAITSTGLMFTLGTATMVSSQIWVKRQRTRS